MKHHTVARIENTDVWVVVPLDVRGDTFAKTFKNEKEALKYWLGVTLSPEQIEMLMEPDTNKALSHLKEEEYVCKYCGKDYNESQR